MPSAKSPHVLIIGGELGGLTIAQVLRKNGVSYQIFERDSNDHSRTQGWALSLHWSLPELESNLPDDLGPFEQCTVMKNLDIADGASMFNSKGEKTVNFGNSGKEGELRMVRCNRAHLRKMLAQHLDGQWNNRFVKYEETEEGVTVFFEDETTATGDILVGADGLHSRVRKQLLAAKPVEPLPSPYGIIIGEATLTKDQYQQELENGPSFYIAQGPKTHVFVGLKEVAEDESTAQFYWMYFWDDAEAEKLGTKYWTQTATREQLLEYAQTNAEKEYDPKVTQLIRLATTETLMYPPLQLYQWAPYPELPVGKVTILGDAAHPMLPFRGEGANNAMLDAVRLGGQILKWLKKDEKDWVAMAKKEYEAEMLPRGRESVIRSGAVGKGGQDNVNRAREMSERLAKERANAAAENDD